MKLGPCIVYYKEIIDRRYLWGRQYFHIQILAQEVSRITQPLVREIVGHFPPLLLAYGLFVLVVEGKYLAVYEVNRLF